MRVKLVFAPPAATKGYEVLAENMWPPLGVLYLAASLRETIPSVQVTVTDGGGLGYEATLAAILADQPQIVGISFLTTTALGAFRLSRDIKKRMPATIVILGGPHATALPTDSLRDSGADLVLVGEGEKSFPHAVRNIIEAQGRLSPDLWKDVPGACYHTNSPDQPTVQNPPPPYVNPLDQLPLPAWDLLDLSKYRGWYLAKQQPEVPILSARGCPFHCTFCSNAVWKCSKPTWRQRSAKNVVDEIEFLHKTYGIREVFDQADEFNASLDHALDICRELKRRNLGITWKAQLRASPFNEELAKAMAEAGCWYVHLGIETGNQETLDGIGKHITLPEVESTARLLRKYNIKVLALFMLYNVWERDGKLQFEDSATTENTLRYAKRLASEELVNYISWSVTMPYPGSMLYDIATRHRLIDPTMLQNWESWQTEELFLMNLPGVTRREQGVLKRKGEFLRAKCLLRSGGFNFKNLLFMFKRGMHVLLASRGSMRRDCATDA